MGFIVGLEVGNPGVKQHDPVGRGRKVTGKGVSASAFQNCNCPFWGKLFLLLKNSNRKVDTVGPRYLQDTEIH